ncbi:MULTISPECIES: tartrate dehydrogenase [unclassified Psychrobacillus]|uniref:tartrate dehydrogenase n=1 Tax=unclassified Psychrobacillus TaxID=2636677 RepID=UPI00146B4A6E|nr:MULTISPECIES: tartrate dehydrogenase [unclassified Psychrobacillus]MCM3356634.1 tartrate dehydrogenase [Psychrobacillus sp. MER TA 171]NME07817.1 tartrate dehydrogenase [Psychrobacillus sp. BL-248-WT-3]
MIHKIACIPGDGIGPEVMTQARRVLQLVEDIHGGVTFEVNPYEWNCDYYLKHGKMMPEDGLSILKDYEAILFGAVGDPKVPNHISVWELILPIRRAFQQYINLRPIKLLKGIQSPLVGKGVEDIDFVVVRENTEGEYSNSGGRLHAGTPYEVVVQNSVFTRMGSERVIKYAYELAQKRGSKHLSVATKSNAINFSMPFWDEIAKEIGAGYPEIEAKFYHIDALVAFFVSKPEIFDVVVGSNLFGDILTDLGAAISGGLGITPSGNINPEKQYPSMFEAIHGSAPDIAGKGIANPIAQIWSTSLMLEHLGYSDLANVIVDGIEETLVEGKVRTPDLGGNANTTEFTEEIMKHIKSYA